MFRPPPRRRIKVAPEYIDVDLREMIEKLPVSSAVDNATVLQSGKNTSAPKSDGGSTSQSGVHELQTEAGSVGNHDFPFDLLSTPPVSQEIDTSDPSISARVETPGEDSEMDTDKGVDTDDGREDNKTTDPRNSKTPQELHLRSAQRTTHQALPEGNPMKSDKSKSAKPSAASSPRRRKLPNTFGFNDVVVDVGNELDPEKWTTLERDVRRKLIAVSRELVDDVVSIWFGPLLHNDNTSLIVSCFIDNTMNKRYLIVSDYLAFVSFVIDGQDKANPHFSGSERARARRICESFEPLKIDTSHRLYTQLESYTQPKLQLWRGTFTVVDWTNLAPMLAAFFKTRGVNVTVL